MKISWFYEEIKNLRKKLSMQVSKKYYVKIKTKKSTSSEFRVFNHLIYDRFS